MNSKNVFATVMTVCLLLCAGCGQNVSVKGKVKLTDGTPVGRGQVVFENAQFSARGDIKDDGSYVLGSLKADDGLPPGEYTVYITGATQAGESVSGQVRGGGGVIQTITIPSLTPIIAAKYTSASTSDLKCNVNKSMTFDITVEPAGQ